jgi:hypothetical protein
MIRREGATPTPDAIRDRLKAQGRSKKQLVPIGFCQCGCGEETAPATHTEPRKGWVKGEPLRFLPGHNRPKVATT